MGRGGRRLDSMIKNVVEVPRPILFKMAWWVIRKCKRGKV